MPMEELDLPVAHEQRLLGRMDLPVGDESQLVDYPIH